MNKVHSAYWELQEQGKEIYPASLYVFIYQLISQASIMNTNMNPQNDSDNSHVSPEKICALFCQEAKNQFGVFTNLVMKNWGVENSEAVGEVVFKLAEKGCIKLNGSEKIEDFTKAGLHF